MSQKIIVHKSRLVDDISFEYFCVADGWTLPKSEYRNKSRRINRKIYVWKLRKKIKICLGNKERPFGKPIDKQGFALLSDIKWVMENGFTNLNPITRSAFLALTKSRFEKLKSTSVYYAERAQCKRPFDVFKNKKKAKVYHCLEGVYLCTLGGKILIRN